MKPSSKAMQNKKGKSIPRNETRSKSETARMPIRSAKSLSRGMKNKIWHNWLMEENYLF